MQIVVLGMHESGASVVTRLLHAMGAHPGEGRELEGVDLNDLAGPWERIDLRQLNDRALAAMGKSWMDCGDLTLSDLPQWELQHFREGAKEILKSLDKRRPWVLSDPRTTLMLDLWRPCFAQPVYVLVHRSPSAVAQAVRARHGVIGHQFSLALWERYNIAALSGTARFPRVLLSYDRMLDDMQGAVRQLHSDLAELGVKGIEALSEGRLRAFAEAIVDDAEQNSPQMAINRRQQALADALTSGAALRDDPPAVSASSQAALERAAHRWPGQPWLKRLLQLRDQELQDWRDSVERRRRPLADRSKGVFVIGCPRSGTSVLSWTLAQHPSFLTGAESDYLLALFGNGRLRDVHRQSHQRADLGWLRQQEVGFAEFASMLGLGIEQLYASRTWGKRWVDATPGYTLMAEDLLCMFPAAKFLHIVRDGRAVVSSMMSSGFDTDWAADFAVACRTWVQYALSGLEAAQSHPDRVIDVRYEDLTENPESELGRVFEFLGELPSALCVDFIATQRINSSYGNVKEQDIRLPKDPRAAPKRPWRNWSADRRRTFADIAGAAMAELGYDLDG